MAGPVPRVGRMLDVVGIALVVVGAVCYGRAYIGMERLRASGFVAYAPGESWGAVHAWEQLRLLSWTGVVLIMLGVAIAVGAALVARMHRTRRLSPGDGAA